MRDKDDRCGQFHQHFTRSFCTRKFREQLFCTYILDLYFFDARILVQTLLLKNLVKLKPKKDDSTKYLNRSNVKNFDHPKALVTLADLTHNITVIRYKDVEIIYRFDTQYYVIKWKDNMTSFKQLINLVNQVSQGNLLNKLNVPSG